MSVSQRFEKAASAALVNIRSIERFQRGPQGRLRELAAAIASACTTLAGGRAPFARFQRAARLCLLSSMVTHHHSRPALLSRCLPARACRCFKIRTQYVFHPVSSQGRHARCVGPPQTRSRHGGSHRPPAPPWQPLWGTRCKQPAGMERRRGCRSRRPAALSAACSVRPQPSQQPSPAGSPAVFSIVTGKQFMQSAELTGEPIKMKA